jgi:hypothetical protein
MGVLRCSRASFAAAAMARSKSWAIKSKEARICRIVPLSVMSWVVAPQWQYLPASPSHRWAI